MRIITGHMCSHVDMRMYRVIYDAINEIESAMKGMLAPKFREALLGHAEVRQTRAFSGASLSLSSFTITSAVRPLSSVR